MSQRKVLVIDDSSTIRRLVDTTLSPLGYSVTAAASAEEGIATATSLVPDIIILDHQLPGTTGVEVCSQLLVNDNLKDIPVVASSTLRKKAYVEYADCPNVVDMLPKPYTGELLAMTVANVLDTAAMVVGSQREGTAVPEVLQAVDAVSLFGDFATFSLRAVLDFLNNAGHEGVLEIEGGVRRVWIYLGRGRVQAVTATGIDPAAMVDRLPESLRDLGPVLRLTVGGGSCSQIDGLVQLLDNKVLDPRLLQKLLRFQAASVLLDCFHDRGLKTFQFESNRQPPALHARLALDTSLVALLVEACLELDETQLPAYAHDQTFVRRAIRGQNLDRAGLSAKHQKLLGLLNEPVSITGLTERTKWNSNELVRVLHALVLADLAEVKASLGRRVVVLDPNPQMTLQLRDAAQSSECPFDLKVVRDRLSLQLVLRRQKPDVVVLAIDHEVGQQAMEEFAEILRDLPWIAITDGEATAATGFAAKICRPYGPGELFQAIGDAQSAQLETA